MNVAKILRYKFGSFSHINDGVPWRNVEPANSPEKIDRSHSFSIIKFPEMLNLLPSQKKLTEIQGIWSTIKVFIEDWSFTGWLYFGYRKMTWNQSQDMQK